MLPTGKSCLGGKWPLWSWTLRHHKLSCPKNSKRLVFYMPSAASRKDLRCLILSKWPRGRTSVEMYQAKPFVKNSWSECSHEVTIVFWGCINFCTFVCFKPMDKNPCWCRHDFWEKYFQFYKQTVGKLSLNIVTVNLVGVILNDFIFKRPSRYHRKDWRNAKNI